MCLVVRSHYRGVCGGRQQVRVRANAAINWESEVLLLKTRMNNLRQKQQSQTDSAAGTSTFSKGAMATFRKRVKIEHFYQSSISSRPALPTDVSDIENNIEEIKKVQDWHAEQWRKYAELVNDKENDDDDENL
eukprot:TRINITY_DN7141_c0_g3_i1.p4 TRINITY_DN7141_c0_g3~~TRINITY_DN7141_c0_g3_i1.p4  ORF type:complete len:133 (-),score=22.53 TRINITY_DN7141_c0_g3_i1:398-796(-)